MAILVTGAAGFIGMATSRALLARGDVVIGVDNLNDYYPPSLKKARLDLLRKDPNFAFFELNIADPAALEAALEKAEITTIIHLAAQAGVRYSLEQPFAYEEANLRGHLAMLEFARNRKIGHLVYASSSSVYGRNEKIPFSEADQTDDQASLYGVTKKAGELMAASYAKLYALPQTGLRFFTVYGPWGRPDMAYWIFTRKILRDEPIEIYNHGQMARDFTFIDDIVAGVLAAHDQPPDESASFHRIFNLGNDQPEALGDLVTTIETALGKTATKIMKPMQPGDVERTWADISSARAILGFNPKTPLKEGIAKFTDWYQKTGLVD